ncbi:MAG: J domain-containing protein, partial [Myxococcota bacterium]|nr:J domain-containing protein [Myxococcota bacterium]
MRHTAPTPLPRMLLDLHRAGFQGWLALDQGAHPRRVEWRRGAPVRLASAAPDEAPGALLVARGLLSAADRERALREAERRGAEELTAIAGLKLVPPRELLLALRQQLHDLLVAACGWSAVGVDVRPTEEAGPALPIPPLDVPAVVAEGVAAHWSAEAVRAALGARADAYLRVREDGRRWRARLDAETAEPLFAALDGRRRGRELLAALDDRRAHASLFVLHALGALEAGDAPAPAAGEEDEPDSEAADAAPEIEVVVAGGDAADRAAADDGPADDGEAAEAGLDPEAAALREEILELHGRLAELDHYALLGVERDAAAGQIKKAYLKAAKRLHPDRLARMGLEAVKDEANDVFARITEAHTVLSDPDQRRRDDEGGEADEEAQRLAQAEALFLKAEMLMRAGNFLGAVEYLETVVSLWPEEASYQAALAWTLFKKNP